MSLLPFPLIHADRVALRPVDTADLADLLEINGDPEVTRFLPYATWKSESDGQAWLDRMNGLSAAGTARQLVVARRSDSKVIGTVLLFRYEPSSSRLEIGYVLGRDHWRKGYAREALALAIDHAFTQQSIRRIEAEVNPANHASNGLLRTLGFRHEGVLRQRWVDKGNAYDVNVYGLLASEWATR
jgi:ribosomal-protein-alanine N-acetyltransferase